MREYERNEPLHPQVQRVQVPPRASGLPTRRRYKRSNDPTVAPRQVNRTAVLLGDPLMVVGALLRVFSRRK